MAERQRNETTKKALEALQAEPYRYAHDGLMANTVELPANGPIGGTQYEPMYWSDGRTSIHNLWTVSRQVLLHWSPERIELEALRRAADNAAPSVISREVQALTALYLGYMELVGQNLALMASDFWPEIRFYLDAFRETLLALERRAATSEARALDFRLRLEFEHTRRTIENKEAASALAEAIKTAVANPDPGAIGAAIGALHQKLDPIEQRLIKVHKDVDFMAGLMGDAFVKAQLPVEQLKKTLVGFKDALLKAQLLEAAKAVAELLK